MNSSVNAASHRRNTLFRWSITVILAIACVYLLISRNEQMQDHKIALENRQHIIDSVKSNRLYLQADFDAASVRIDQLMTVNVALEDSMIRYKDSIAQLRTRIRTILDNRNAAQTDLLMARDMLYLLVDKIQNYQLYIAELEKDNETLAGANEQLKEERDQTVEKNISLKMAGSVLHASNVRMQFIRVRRSGKEKEASKAGRTTMFRVTFDIDENRVAESGRQDIYMRLLTPRDTLVFIEGVSGVMNTMKGGKTGFSAATEVKIVKGLPVKGVKMQLDHCEISEKGTYRVELYNQGFKIGEGTLGMK